jgi:hypothetical protein
VALAVVFNLINPTASFGNFQLSSLFGLPEAPSENDHQHDSAPFAKDFQFVIEEEVDESETEFDDDDASNDIDYCFPLNSYLNRNALSYEKCISISKQRLFILYCSLKIDF